MGPRYINIGLFVLCGVIDKVQFPITVSVINSCLGKQKITTPLAIIYTVVIVYRLDEGVTCVLPIRKRILIMQQENIIIYIRETVSKWKNVVYLAVFTTFASQLPPFPEYI